MSAKPKNSRRSKGEEPDPAARRKQIFIGIAMGAVVGLVLSLLTQFWLWLPAGLAMGLATGAIMKPPRA
ncbi:HPP family protein [Leucobacter ruminantium]|uniref:HPP family protein n=1 Tax=Leucobacter ruminantium TaxID=1289170 RepID=A0A939RZB0_9MICO|nr:HPP family protein [Leucobacter ruminantium]MBO1806543.1 HPP family protein [Leucobacter ruminantium]